MAYEKPIQINPDEKLRAKIEREAKAENRKHGPMVLEIVRRYFQQKEAIR
jgi:hypothetical protein